MSNKMKMVYEKVPLRHVSPMISRKEVSSDERLYITRVLQAKEIHVKKVNLYRKESIKQDYIR